MRAKNGLRLICCGFGLLVFLVAASTANAELLVDIVFQDGAFHQFDGICQHLTVRNNILYEPTRVEMVSPAYVNSDAWVYDTSELTILSGFIGHHLYAFDSSLVTISGGSIGGDLLVGPVLYDHFAFPAVWPPFSDSHVTVSGGTIGGTMHIFSTLTVVGSDFVISGRPIDRITAGGEVGPYMVAYGTLSGTFLDGKAFTNDFELYGNGRLVLIPEPATLSLLAVGGLLLLRRRAA